MPLLTSDPDGDMSAYYSFDLKGVAADHGVSGDVYDDAETLLRVCLHARDEYDELAGETPPYKALVAVADRVGLRFEDPEQRILGDDSYRLAPKVYADLSPSDWG